MVDNVPITAGSGTNVASDDIAGVHYQRVKTTWGPDGTANDADVATGKPLPTQIRSATGLIPIGEPTDAKNTATDTTSVSGISIWKQISASVQALVTAFGAALSRAAGAVDANTQRVTLASDDPVVARLGALDAAKETDPDAASAALLNLIRGLLQSTQDATVSTGTAGTPAAEVLTVQGVASMTPVQVETSVQFVTVSMTTPTDALDAGDVVAATQVVAACTRANDVKAILHSVTVIDTDDQKAKLRLVLFDANTALGTEDVAPDIDDTEILTVQGYVDIAVADYIDLGGASFAHKSNLGVVVKPATGTDDIYLALYTPDTSTPTYASGVVTVRLGFI